MPYIGAVPDKGNFADLNGAKLILDADADTHITADTDDQIDIQIAGADDFQFTANTLTVLSGSTLTIASGATIANSGTATGFSSADPTSADGDSLGTASAEWSDLYLADGGVIYFGNDQEITMTHSADAGLILKNNITTDDNGPFNLSLHSGETDIALNDILGKIYFAAPDEATGTDAILTAAAIQARSEGDFSSSNNATSLDFMTAASETAAKKMTLTSAGILNTLKIGVITDHDLGAGLHIRTADSSGSAHADADELVIEGSGHSGMTFLAGTSSTSNINFGDSGGNNQGQIIYDHSNTYMRFNVETSGALFLDNDKSCYIGGVTNTNATNGSLTIQQDGADDDAFAVKSTDIAHGMTGHADTDTFGAFRKFSSTGGGFCIEGYTEGTAAFAVEAAYNSSSTTKGSSGRAAIEMRGYLQDGTAVGNTGANINMFLVNADGDVTGFLVDSDGDLHYDGSTSAFDEYDDALMLRTFMHEQTPDGVIKTEFDKFLKYNKKSLEESGIIGTIDPDDPDCYHADGTLSRPLICLTQLQRLEVGAIVQQRAMFETMKSVVEEMLPGFSKKLNERLEAQSLPALPV